MPTQALNFKTQPWSILKNQFKISVTISDEIESQKEYEAIYQEIGDIRYIESIKHLLTYITRTQKRNLTHLQTAIIKEQKKYLKIQC